MVTKGKVQGGGIKVENTALNKMANKSILKLASMSVGRLFGEDDILHDRLRLGTVTCSTNKGLLYAMKKSEFFRRFKVNDETWKTVLNQVEIKDENL